MNFTPIVNAYAGTAAGAGSNSVFTQAVALLIMGGSIIFWGGIINHLLTKRKKAKWQQTGTSPRAAPLRKKSIIKPLIVGFFLMGIFSFLLSGIMASSSAKPIAGYLIFGLIAAFLIYVVRSYKIGSNGRHGRLQEHNARLAGIVLPSKEGLVERTPKDIRSRLLEWVSVRSVRPVSEDAAALAGEDGERRIIALLENSRELKDAFIFAGRRVPKTKDHRLIPSNRSEIDIILLSHKAIHVIEVKNWSGVITPGESEDVWIREKRDGTVTHVQNPVLANKAKAWSLLQFLKSKHIPIQDEWVTDHLFLVNGNAIVDYHIAQSHEVVTASEIASFAQGAGIKALDRIIIRMMRIILDRENSNLVAQGLTGAMPEQLFLSIKEELRKIHTWDRLELYGGAIKTGDLLEIRTHGEKIAPDDFQPGEYIQLQWQRNVILSLVYALFGKGIGMLTTAKSRLPADTTGHIHFHFAGQPKPEVVPITLVDVVRRG